MRWNSSIRFFVISVKENNSSNRIALKIETVCSTADKILEKRLMLYFLRVHGTKLNYYIIT